MHVYVHGGVRFRDENGIPLQAAELRNQTRVWGAIRESGWQQPSVGEVVGKRFSLRLSAEALTAFVPDYLFKDVYVASHLA